MKTISRFLLLSSVVVGTLVLPHVALGSDAPKFGDLPVGRFTTPPTKKVGSVGARESVPGLFVVPPGNGLRGDATTIVADPRLVPFIKTGQGWNQEDNPSACVLENRGFSFDTLVDQTHEWSENLSAEAQAWRRSGDNPMSGVTAVHVERIVEQNGTTTLESVDAWVDPGTRGARLISKASLPLKLVRGPMFGMKIYAGRDERPDGKRFVQFVAVRSSSAENARTGQMWSMRPDGQVAHSSGCGHARLGLPADGTNDTGTFVATVLLEGAKDGDKKDIDKNDNGVVASPVRPTRAKPAPGAAPPVRRSTTESEVRSRMVHIQVSVSKTSRDKDPVVSVSSSWAGREQVERSGLSSGAVE
jgi:hypothetical protein